MTELLGALRVTALLLTVHVALGALAWTRAEARASEHLLDVGAEMLGWLGPTRRDPPRDLRLNGLAVHVDSGSLARPLGDVLDRFVEACRRRGPGLGRLLGPLGAAGRSLRAALPDGVLDATLWLREHDRALSACLDVGTTPLSADELVRRVAELAEEADPAALGDLRFLYAERRDGRTHYLVLHTEGSMALRAMFPSDADAPGRDPAGLPRPEHSRRLLSAWQLDERPLLSVYALSGDPDRARTTYEARLRDADLYLRTAPSEGQVLVESSDASWLLSFGGTEEQARLAITRLD